MRNTTARRERLGPIGRALHGRSGLVLPGSTIGAMPARLSKNSFPKSPKFIGVRAVSDEPYVEWFARVFGKHMPIPNTLPFSTFEIGTPWSDKVAEGMLEAETLYAEHLLEQLEADKIAGDIIEFGIYRGGWINFFCETLERRNWVRNVWGFDSFEGLPKPDEKLDQTSFWTEGMYSASYDVVTAFLRPDQRPYLHLVKGWFNETLTRPPATSIEKVAYVRIDCDLYSSTLDCLKFLDNRLVDGSILVFDDWMFTRELSGPRAFGEWLDAGADKKYKFEYLAFNLHNHLYSRVTLI